MTLVDYIPKAQITMQETQAKFTNQVVDQDAEAGGEGTILVNPKTRVYVANMMLTNLLLDHPKTFTTCLGHHFSTSLNHFETSALLIYIYILPWIKAIRST